MRPSSLVSNCKSFFDQTMFQLFIVKADNSPNLTNIALPISRAVYM